MSEIYGQKKLWGEVGGSASKLDRIESSLMPNQSKPATPEQWVTTVSSGAAGKFHEKRPADETGPQIWIHRPTTPTLVLGSSQLEEVVNTVEVEKRGVDVCRRRSGGGLVYIDPKFDCWIDLIIPSTSQLFDPDIARAFHWVGLHWAETLRRYFNRSDPESQLGRQPDSQLDIVMATSNQRTAASELLCFAGLGHGELTIDGRKVVGLSQRRSRSWARIQSIMTNRWDSSAIEPLIAPSALKAIGSTEIHAVAAGLPYYLQPPDPTALSELFIAHLPNP